MSTESGETDERGRSGCGTSPGNGQLPMNVTETAAAPRPTWVIAPEPPDSPAAATLWRAYYTEVSDRWYLLHEQRTTPPEELAREIAANDGDGLHASGAVLLVARYGDEPAGTAGIRLLDPATAELKRVFIHKELRGLGGGRVLLGAAEDAARALGAARIVLDTRHDLVEARALYARHGYQESPPHNTSVYAEHWLSKSLTTGRR